MQAAHIVVLAAVEEQERTGDKYVGEPHRPASNTEHNDLALFSICDKTSIDLGLVLGKFYITFFSICELF
jgi:hypothetical protein